MQASRVLIVEDDALVRRAYERVLRRQFDITSVPSGAHGIDALKEAPFSALLSDMDLPGMTGLELLQVVRGSNPELPVLFVTGHPSMESAQAAVALGASSYLTKPVDAVALTDALLRAIRGPSAQRLHASSRPVHGEGLVDDDERLTRALRGLHMVYQPVVSTTARKTIGYEALLRTAEPSLRTPLDLLALAERLDRIEEVGRVTRARIAEDIALAPVEARIFVNLHARELDDSELERELGPHARRIVLELTERASLEDMDAAASRIRALRGAGFRLAIDDLGAGYGALASMAQLNPDFVKLDLALVRGIETATTRRRLVASIVKTCRTLGMTVLAEGIETIEERDALIELGCDALQGYLFARPTRGFACPTY